MTLAQLRTFVAVADTGSVRAAADHLIVTQSAVSASLAALQSSLELQLVEREGRGLRLTPAGEIYADYARRILGLLDEAAAAAAGGEEPARGRLRIAAVTTAGEQVLPTFLAGFRERYPDATLSLEVGTRERVWSLLAAHEIDVVIAGRPPADLDLHVRAVRSNELVVVGAPGSTLNIRKATWLLREAGSGTRATTEAFLESRDADPARLTLGSNGAVVAGAAAGLGITLVSRDAVGRQLRNGELEVLAVDGTPLSRPWHASTGAHPTATADLFLRYLLEERERDGPPWQAVSGERA